MPLPAILFDTMVGTGRTTLIVTVASRGAKDDAAAAAVAEISAKF